MKMPVDKFGRNEDRTTIVYTGINIANLTKFISYLDANNLYGWAMSKQLPTSGFKWRIRCQIMMLQPRVM